MNENNSSNAVVRICLISSTAAEELFLFYAALKMRPQAPERG